MSVFSIEPTIFKNPRDGHETYGFRMYDENDKCYDNTWDSIPSTDMEVLEKVALSDDDRVRDSLSLIREKEEGLEISGQFYSWKEIRDYLS